MLAIIALGLLLCLLVAAVVTEVREQRVHRAADLSERLRIQRVQFMAERQLQKLTEAAFQQLLDEARPQQQGTTGNGDAPVDEWYRP